MQRCITMSVMVMVMVALSTAGVQASTKKIRPDELKPRTSDTVFRRDPISISAGPFDFAQFYTIVKLPIGSCITSLYIPKIRQAVYSA